MEKHVANYLGQSNNDFPVDCETMDYINQRIALCEALGAMGGDKIILSGCVDNGTTRSAGYIFLKTTDYPEGEVLRFEGGNTSATFAIRKTNIDITAEGETYSGAYTKRSAVTGTGTETYNWSEMTEVSGVSNRALKGAIEERTMVGMIVLYPVNQHVQVNEHWIECNGASYSGQTYPELYEILKGSGGSMSFNVPNIAATGGCKYYIYAGKKVGIS